MMLNFDLLTIDEAIPTQPHDYATSSHLYALKWHTLSLHYVCEMSIFTVQMGGGVERD